MNFFLHFGPSDQGNAAQEGECDEEGEGRKQGGHQGDLAGELMVTAHHLGKSRTGYCRRRANYHKDKRQFRAPEAQGSCHGDHHRGDHHQTQGADSQVEPQVARSLLGIELTAHCQQCQRCGHIRQIVDGFGGKGREGNPAELCCQTQQNGDNKRVLGKC